VAGPGPERLDQTRLAAARLLAVEAHPFLAVALYALTPVADDDTPTFAVDESWRLYVNPRRLAEWAVTQTAGVLLHEVSHVIRDHAGRARAVNVSGEESRRRWNLAADAEINDDLLAAGIELPPDPVTPQTLGMPAAKVAEFYYGRLGDTADVPPIVPHCGSGCHGQDERADGASTLLLPAGLSSTQALLVRKRVAEQTTAFAAQHPGVLAGGWLRWAEAVLRPRLDWRTLLAAKIRSSAASVSGAADYSYSRPARRRVPRVVLPAMRSPIPRIAVIVDTSGSVDDHLLALAWTEVHGCLRQLGIRRDLLTVYAADTRARPLQGVLGRQVSLPGGGGTDMAAALDAVLAARPIPDLVVVITDGLTPWPQEKPSRDVIVALLPTPFPPPPAPAWARMVKIDATDGSVSPAQVCQSFPSLGHRR
jgi:predicted metal-dependent peptidase